MKKEKKPQKILVILANHVIFHEDGFVEGAIHQVKDFLNRKSISVIEINYDLYGSLQREIVNYTFGKINTSTSFPAKKKSSDSLLPVRYLYELINTLTIIFKNRHRKILFIGVDPLNALAGYISKKFRLVDIFITYTADYAKKRFDNRFLNFCYHFVDKLTAKSADETWGVSTRIVNLRRKQKVKKEKNLQMPNSPFFDRIKRLNYKKIELHTLVIVSTISKATDFRPVIDALNILKEKIPDITLKFIGDGNSKNELAQYVVEKKMQNFVKFLGHMSHDQVYTVLSKSGIGIAPYTNNAPWTHYCNPMKVYDYLASGLPVVITDVPALAHKIVQNQAGEIFDLFNSRDLSTKILKIIEKPAIYQQYRTNAINIARNNDKEKLLNQWLLRFDNYFQYKKIF